MLFIVLPILFLRKIQKASLKVVLTEVIVKYDKYGDSQEGEDQLGIKLEYSSVTWWLLLLFHG